MQPSITSKIFNEDEPDRARRSLAASALKTLFTGRDGGEEL